MTYRALLLVCLVGCTAADDRGGQAIGRSGDSAVRRSGDSAKTSGIAVVTDIRVAGHDMYDRIVFEIEGDLPANEVKWVTGPVFQCGSGEEVPLPGNATLVVKLSPANGHTESGEATSPGEVAGGQSANILLAKRICDFEADVQYAVAVKNRTDFRVSELTGPTRLVVDVRTGL